MIDDFVRKDGSLDNYHFIRMETNEDNNLQLTENGSNNNKEDPRLQDEIINLHESDGSDIEIIAVSKSVAEGKTKNKLRNFIRNRRKTKIYVNSVNTSAKNQDSYIKEEIIISDASDSDNDSPNKFKSFNRPINRCNFKGLRNSLRKVPNSKASLSSIILNCPRCNKTKTVFSTTLGKITCKDCNVNMFYVCNKCNLRYQTMLALYRHKKLQCESLISRDSLSTKNMFILKCSKCNLTQKIRHLKISRCLTCRINMPFECMVCSKSFNTYSNLYFHLKHRCQLSYRTYYCNECKFSCTNQTSLSRHIKTIHSELFVIHKIVKCCKCEQIFKDGANLKKHEIVCGLSLFQCKFCLYKPKYQDTLIKHLTTRHANLIIGKDIFNIVKESIQPQKKNRDCIINIAPSKSSNDIIREIKDYPKFVYCKNCEMTSEYSKGIRKCITCHTALRYCCKNCTGSYQGLPSLYRHIHRQHGDKNHICKNCGRNFSFLGDANEHSKTCGTEPRFECEICYFKTRYKYNLRNHMYKIHNENRKDYVCEDCGIRYKTEKSFKSHVDQRCQKRIIREMVLSGENVNAT